MPISYYNRYKGFNIDGEFTPLPFITINPKRSDKTVVYKTDRDRLDKMSQKYYNNPYYGWLILLANPQHGGLETNIPYGSILSVPFPLNATLQEYQGQIIQFNNLYGING